MKTLVLSLLATLALGSVAVADPVTFKDEAGNVWTVTNGGNGADVSALHMFASAAIACPGRRVKLEPSKRGPKMTREQRDRGDQRWHIVCDRSAPPANPQAEQPAPPPAAQPPAQQQPPARSMREQPRTYLIRS